MSRAKPDAALRPSHGPWHAPRPLLPTPWGMPPFPTLSPGPQIACCGRWHPISTLPMRLACCGRVLGLKEERTRHEPCTP